MIADVLREAEDKMKKTVQALRQVLGLISNGRAGVSLLDKVTVDAYGDTMPLNQLATINVAESNTLVIIPYDKATLSAIERGISKATLGFTINNDGRLVRVVVPALTETQRKETVKLVRSRTEEAKVSLRNAKREALDSVRQMEGAQLISADEVSRALEALQLLTDRYTREVEAVQMVKEQELVTG